MDLNNICGLLLELYVTYFEDIDGCINHRYDNIVACINHGHDMAFLAEIISKICNIMHLFRIKL